MLTDDTALSPARSRAKHTKWPCRENSPLRSLRAATLPTQLTKLMDPIGSPVSGNDRARVPCYQYSSFIMSEPFTFDGCIGSVHENVPATLDNEDLQAVRVLCGFILRSFDLFEIQHVST